MRWPGKQRCPALAAGGGAFHRVTVGSGMLLWRLCILSLVTHHMQVLATDYEELRYFA